MLNNSNQEPMIPLADEEFDPIRKTIQGEATKLMEEYKSRGLLPAHLIATASVLLATLTQIPGIDRVMAPITAYSMQAIGEIERKKVN